MKNIAATGGCRLASADIAAEEVAMVALPDDLVISHHESSIFMDLVHLCKTKYRVDLP